MARNIRIPGMVNELGQPFKGDELLVKTTPLPLALMAQFIGFLSDPQRRLPNGQQSTLPALAGDDFALLGTPYPRWAPAPYNETIRSDSALNRFAMTLSGMDQLMDMDVILAGGLPGVNVMGHEMAYMRASLWAGIVPLSVRRWRQKNLADPANFDQALAVLEKANTFMSFSIDSIADKTRAAYNRAYAALASWDLALAAHRGDPNGNLPKAADLWNDFFFSHVDFIAARCYAWYAARVDELQAALLQALRDAPRPPAGAREQSPAQRAAFNKFMHLLEVVTTADASIVIPLAGFKNTLPRWALLSDPARLHPLTYDGSFALPGWGPADIRQRLQHYDTRQRFLVREAARTPAMVANSAAADTDPLGPEPLIRVYVAALGAHTRARREMRGEPVEIKEELWVSAVKRALEPVANPDMPVFTKWGFVGYRVSYGRDEGAWDRFLEAFRVDVGGWGEGVAGAGEIKGMGKVKWIDGRECGIAEGDVEGARRHFQTLTEGSGRNLQGLKTIDAFLVADKAAIDSYLTKADLPGQNLIDPADLGGFVLVADAKFDPAQAARDIESPLFDGTVRVLGSVLFEDLWPQLFLHVNPLKALWPIACSHPLAIYMGPTAEYQVKRWKAFDAVRARLAGKAMEWVSTQGGPGYD
ncbi:hypothetical protein B0T22DRAFT_481669 [Podospora appendiculata]|uniref:Uncharacterized protein n=1 Tax=Podospora appendiculata TaxID=314037 RepID=A0AAE1CED3_9PEZI|nr:hypothetical protein B0T22DRAFT_481669 [Podospora appendiculata]